MNRVAQGVVLLLLGGAALRASLTDMYLRYVKESLQPFLIVASALLVVAGAMTIWYELRGSANDGDADGHGHGEPRVGWLLIAPVLGLLMVAPPALGAYSVSNTGATTNRPGAEFPELPEVSLVELTMVDYAARAIWDDGRSLEGRRVALTGFLATSEGGEQFLTRLTLSCCAADSRPVKIGMTGAVPAGLADDTWIEVIGTYTGRTGVDPINGAELPYIEVEHWQEVPEPRDPYE